MYRGTHALARTLTTASPLSETLRVDPGVFLPGGSPKHLRVLPTYPCMSRMKRWSMSVLSGQGGCFGVPTPGADVQDACSGSRKATRLSFPFTTTSSAEQFS